MVCLPEIELLPSPAAIQTALTNQTVIFANDCHSGRGGFQRWSNCQGNPHGESVGSFVLLLNGATCFTAEVEGFIVTYNGSVIQGKHKKKTILLVPFNRYLNQLTCQ